MQPAAQELKYQLIERLRAQTQELQSLMGSNNDTERSLIVGKQSN